MYPCLPALRRSRSDATYMYRTLAQVASFAIITGFSIQSTADPKPISLENFDWVPQFVFPAIGVAFLVGSYFAQVREQKRRMEAYEKNAEKMALRLEKHVEWDSKAHEKINRDYDRIMGRFVGLLDDIGKFDSGTRGSFIGKAFSRHADSPENGIEDEEDEKET